MTLVRNSGLTAGTTGLWWFAQDLQNLGTALTGDAVLFSSTYDSGNGFILHDATPDGTLLAADPTLVIPTTAVTIMFSARCTDTTLRAESAIGIITATLGERCGAHLPYSDGKVYWDFGGATEGVTRLSIAWAKDTTEHIWALTTGARGMEIWRDGTKIATNAATPTRSATTGDFGLGRHAGNNSDLYEFRWAFVHTTQLAEATIAAISADPEGELTETFVFSGTPFEPDHWSYRGAVMPTASSSVVPTSYSVSFNGYLYVSEQGQFQNVAGYPFANQDPFVGFITRTTDGGTWTVAWDGNATQFGQLRWVPGQLFVIGAALYCFIGAGATAFVASSAIIGDGELALMRSTDGTTWSKVATFATWAASSHGTKIDRAVEFTACYWHARRSSAGGDDWLIASWAVRNDGTGGSFYTEGTQRYRSSNGGLTWTFVAEMKEIAPFTANPNTLDGPSAVYPIWRSPILGDRWFMFGGNGTMNWSDDEGTTWTTTIWSTLPAPAWTYPLSSGGMVILGHGSSALVPIARVSCDLGVNATNVPSGQSYEGFTPVNTLVASLQFQATGSDIVGEGGEQLLAVMRDNTGTLTAIWWTDNGGEDWTELGQLATFYTTPIYLARIGTTRVVFYTGTTAAAGGPQVWTSDDAPDGVLGVRAICTGLTAIHGLAGVRSYAWVG